MMMMHDDNDDDDGDNTIWYKFDYIFETGCCCVTATVYLFDFDTGDIRVCLTCVSVMCD